MTGTRTRIAACAAVASIALGLGIMGTADARVTGVCSNCHTMHNSQNGAHVVSAGTGASWSASATNKQLTGEAQTGAQRNLTTTDCVGCHSNAGAETIIAIGSGSGASTVPIVYNMTAPHYPDDGVYGTSSTTLAGGNFFWIAQGDDTKGHNVLGISGVDHNLPLPPGRPSAGCSPCHVSLALNQTYTGSYGTYYNGCQACHSYPRHHADDPAGTVIGSTAAQRTDNNYYRFLGGPEGHATTYGFQGVTGIEDNKWEQDASATKHNTYNGGDGVAADPQSMGRFCAGCHIQFHSPGMVFTQAGNVNINNGGDKTNNSGVPGAAVGGNPWLRHPTDVVIPSDGEYGSVIGSAYDPNVPVGAYNGAISFSSTIRNTDRVFCLSCHRPHGSPYPDMLRWDYSSMNAHSYTTSTNKGCFKCHTTKDDK